MDKENLNNWTEHFNVLELKTSGNKTLEKVLDQIISILIQRNIAFDDVKAAMWSSIAEGENRSFGVMLLFRNKLEFIGAQQGLGKLLQREWNFNAIQIEKVEDPKLGITREMHLIYNNNKIIWNGMKGFVPSLFILTLEKYWFEN